MKKADFLTELQAFFKAKGYAIVPTYEGAISFHDQMAVVKYDADTDQFVGDSWTCAIDPNTGEAVYDVNGHPVQE